MSLWFESCLEMKSGWSRRGRNLMLCRTKYPSCSRYSSTSCSRISSLVAIVAYLLDSADPRQCRYQRSPDARNNMVSCMTYLRFTVSAATLDTVWTLPLVQATGDYSTAADPIGNMDCLGNRHRSVI